MHEPLRPAGEQVLDTRVWRIPPVVGGMGSNRRHSLRWRNMIQAVEGFWFWQIASFRRLRKLIAVGK
jgi:hypothetical protein